MKTKANFNTIASASVFSAALFLLTAFAPVQAGSSNYLLNSEVKAATERLDALNRSFEKVIIFKAPVVAEDASDFDYEVYSATERLENLNSTLEKSIQYTAPSVSEF